MCLSRISRMNPTGDHPNKNRNPNGKPNSSSTRDKFAGRPHRAAAGGGAMASTEVKGGCKFSNKCEDMHCQFTDEQHGTNFTRKTSCWKKELGRHCNICDPPKDLNRHCQFGEKCKNRPNCQFLHPAPVVNVLETSDVQVQPENGETAGSASIEEEFPFLGGIKPALDVVASGDWTREKEDLSSNITDLLKCFPEPYFCDLKQSLEEKLLSFQTRKELLEYVKTLIKALAEVENLEFESDDLEELSKEPLSKFMNLCFGKGTMPVFKPEVVIHDRIQVFLEIQENLNKMVEKLEVSQVSDFPKSGTFITEQIRSTISSIMCMMKQLPPLKQGDFQKTIVFLGVNDVMSFRPELVQQILAFATSSYNKIMDQLRIEEEARKQMVRLSLLDPKQFDVETTITESQLMAMAYMFAISFMMGSNMSFFLEFVNTRFNEQADMISKNQNAFFEHLVRAIYRKLIQCDSNVQVFQRAVLTSDFSSVSDLVEIMFSNAVNWFLLSQKSSEASVYESLMIFSSWNQDSKLLKPEFLKFLYSTMEIGRNQTVQISKLIDNHFKVLEKYFGIRMVASETGFGKKFILSYKKDNQTHYIDVSASVCQYVFDLLCRSKIFIDMNMSSSVPYGNSGIQGSISHLFDLVGNQSLEVENFGRYQPHVLQSKDTKGNPEVVPSIFTPSVFNKVATKLKKDAATHEDVLKYFLDNSIRHLMNCNFGDKSKKDDFDTEVKQIRMSFLPSSTDEVSMLRFNLFLSTLESDPMTKLLKTGIEFLTNESLKKDISRGLNFLTSKDVGEFERQIIKKILQYCSLITHENELNQKVEETVNGLSKALNFVASSGVSLVEVLHTCQIFKDLFNKNKTAGSRKMVFFNTFLTAMMVAGSKKLNLSFETMYKLLVTSLLQNDTNPFLKPTDSFSKPNVKTGVMLIRNTGFQFSNCNRDPHCEMFCKEASALPSEAPENIKKFQDLVALVGPLTMFSDIMSKQDSQSVVAGMSMSLSDCFDRVSMLLLTSHNRNELFQLFGLMNPNVSKDPEQRVWYMCRDTLANSRIKMSVEKQDFEKKLIESMRTSISASAVSDYFNRWNMYRESNKNDMQKCLSLEDRKELQKGFRKNSEMETFFSTLIKSGLATDELIQRLRNNPELYTKTKQGVDRLNIVLIANTIVAESNVFSLHFYEDILKMIHSALYPNFADRAAARNMIQEMVEIQKAARRTDMGQAPVQPVQEHQEQEQEQGLSMFEAMFGGRDDEHEPEDEPEPTAQDIRVSFLETFPENVRQLVDSIVSKSIILTDPKIREFFTNHRNDPSIPELLSILNESFTGLEKSLGFEATIGFFSDINKYVETFFEENLTQFQDDLLNESSPIGAAFKRYLDAEIKEAKQILLN